MQTKAQREQAELIASDPGLLAVARYINGARPKQLPPPGDWRFWLLQAGRGFGKTWCGAGWAMARGILNPGERIALVAPTFSDTRDTCIEGDSGLLGFLPPEMIKAYNRSLGELILTNGTLYKCFAATEPNRMRGPQFHAAWADELSSWQYEDALDQLQFCLRLGDDPRIIVTTTPKPNVLTRRVMLDKRTVVTRGSTFDNADNLAASTLEALKEKYEGTRLGRQELYAEMLEDVVGALWTRAMLDEASQMGKKRTAKLLKDDLPLNHNLVRVEIGVDPSGSDGETGDRIGIVVAGIDVFGNGHVLEDATLLASPDEWAARVAKLYRKYNADGVVAERNYGGDMVKAILQSKDRTMPVRMVTATRGKAVRAAPVAALYEQGKVAHYGQMNDLEDQLVLFTSSEYIGEGSPDRVDALVWVLTSLMLGAAPGAHVPVTFG